MLKLISVVVFVGMFFTAAFAQPPAIEWSRVYGGPGFESLWACTPVTNGRYLIAGTTTGTVNGPQDFWIKLLNAVGTSIWTKTYGSPNDDVCTYSIQTSDGGFMAVGWRGAIGASPAGAWMIKMDANGDSLWTRLIGNTIDAGFYFVQQTSDGGYILAGSLRTSVESGWNGWLVKTDSLGQVQWERSYGGPDVEDFISVAIASDGGYLAAGETGSYGAGSYDGWILKTNANGDSLWSRTYGTALTEGFYTAPRTTDNGYLLTGYRDSLWTVGTNDWMIVKTDLLGNPIWTKYYGNPNAEDVPWQGTEIPGNGYIVAGYFEYPDSNGIDMVGLRLNANGDSLWSARFSGPGVDYGWFVTLTPDGGYLFGADSYSFDNGDDDWWVVKTLTPCTDPTPWAPVVTNNFVGADARLYWSPIKVSLGHCLIDTIQYLVFHSLTPSGPYTYLGTTSDTTYTHVGALAGTANQFYRVTASTPALQAARTLPPVAESYRPVASSAHRTMLSIPRPTAHVPLSRLRGATP
jgi:hypothetical protein